MKVVSRAIQVHTFLLEREVALIHTGDKGKVKPD